MAPGALDWTNNTITFFLHLQFCTTIALNLHRISSVLFYANYEKFWSRFYPIYGLISIIYSILQMLYTGQFYHFEILNNGTLISCYASEAGARAINLAALFSTIYFLLFLIIIFLSVFLVSRKLKTLLFHDSGVTKKLTKIVLTYCVLATGILFWSILNALNVPWLPESLTTRHVILTFCSDMVLINSLSLKVLSLQITLGLPYILLIYDTNVRKDVVGLFVKNNKKNFVNH